MTSISHDDGPDMDLVSRMYKCGILYGGRIETVEPSFAFLGGLSYLILEIKVFREE